MFYKCLDSLRRLISLSKITPKQLQGPIYIYGPTRYSFKKRNKHTYGYIFIINLWMNRSTNLSRSVKSSVTSNGHTIFIAFLLGRKFCDKARLVGMIFTNIFCVCSNFVKPWFFFFLHTLMLWLKVNIYYQENR